jgi:RNA polymerase sigma factor for flagellar operon FliA
MNSSSTAEATSSCTSRPAPKADFDALVLANADLVKRIACHLLARMPPNVEVDDLIQAGMLGLIDAARRYSADRGAAFRSYAGIRIRGAILDEARRADWVPRSLRRGVRQMKDAARRVERRTGAQASPADVAREMGVSLGDFHRLASDSVTARVMSLEQVQALQQQLLEGSDVAAETPQQQLESDDFHAALVAAIEDLPERLRLVLSLYYDDELNLREIGQVLLVTESRVCQLQAQARSEIRARLRPWLDGA